MDPTDWTTLEHLLTSNVAPLPHELTTTQRVINELDTELNTLDERIARLQHKFTQLEARRLLIKNHRRQCAGIISAHRGFPFEITQMIMDVLWKGELQSENIEPSRSPIPLLMLVSREWCHVALATPHCWACLSLEFCSWNSAGVQDVVEGANRWLSRAQNHPLSLSVRIEGGDSRHITTFLTHWAPRIVMLHLNVPEYRSSPIPALLNIIWPEVHTLSIFSTLNLEMGETSLQDIDHKSSTRFPALHSAEVFTSISISVFNTLDIPWGNLVSLMVGFSYGKGNEKYLAVLRECSGRLEEYSIHVRNYTPPPPQVSGKPIVFPHLARLWINSNINLMEAEWVVEFLRFPALRSITYYLPERRAGSHPTERNPIDVITNLVQRSGAIISVRSLELHDLGRGRLPWFSPVRTKELFERLPSLEWFRLALGNADALGYLWCLPKSVQHVEVDAMKVDASDGWEGVLAEVREVSRGRMISEYPLDVELVMPGQLVRIPR